MKKLTDMSGYTLPAILNSLTFHQYKLHNKKKQHEKDKVETK